MNYYTGQWIALKTIIRDQIFLSKRIWIQSIIPPLVTISLIMFIFGYVVGPKLGTIDGNSFSQFMAPGLIMLIIIQTSYGSALNDFFTAKYNRHIEELLVSPVENIVILLRYVLASVIKGFISGVLAMAALLIFTSLPVHSYFVLITTALLTLTFCALAGIVNAFFVSSIELLSAVPTFILTPIIYISGVFYPINLLPVTLQYVSYFNPLVYIINSFRYCFLGTQGEYLFTAYIMLILSTILLFLTALFMLNKSYKLRA